RRVHERGSDPVGLTHRAAFSTTKPKPCEPRKWYVSRRRRQLARGRDCSRTPARRAGRHYARNDRRADFILKLKNGRKLPIEGEARRDEKDYAKETVGRRWAAADNARDNLDTRSRHLCFKHRDVK